MLNSASCCWKYAVVALSSQFGVVEQYFTSAAQFRSSAPTLMMMIDALPARSATASCGWSVCPPRVCGPSSPLVIVALSQARLRTFQSLTADRSAA